MQAYQADRAALAAAILARQLEAQKPSGPAQPITALLNYSPPQLTHNPDSSDRAADSQLAAAASQTRSGISAELSTEVVWRPACEHGLQASQPAPGERQSWPEMHEEEAQLRLKYGKYQGKDSEAGPAHEQRKAHASRQPADSEDASAKHEALLRPWSACDSPDREVHLLGVKPHSPAREQCLLGPPTLGPSRERALLEGAPPSPSRDHPSLGDAPQSPDGQQPLDGSAPHSPSRKQPFLSGAPPSPNREQPNRGSLPDSPTTDDPSTRGSPHSPDREQPSYGDTLHSPDREQPVLGEPLHNPNRHQTLLGVGPHSKGPHAQAPAGGDPTADGKASPQAAGASQEGQLPAIALVQGRPDYVLTRQGTEPSLL